MQGDRTLSSGGRARRSPGAMIFPLLGHTSRHVDATILDFFLDHR